MGDKKITSMYESRDYSKFKFIEGNRDLDHVKKVEKSINSVGYLWQPILVNENYEIVEGQHRFTACKNLGLPIIYIIQPGIGIREVQALNTCSKNWTTKNHIHVRATGELENVSYRYLELLCKQFEGLPVEIIIGATSNNGLAKSSAETIRNGSHKCTAKDYEKAQKILADVKSCVPHVSGTRSCIKRALVFAFNLHYSGIADIDPEHLKKKIEAYGSRLNGRYMEECIQQVEDIYNYRTPISKKRNILFQYKQINANHKKGK